MHSETKKAFHAENLPLRCTDATSHAQATMIFTLHAKNTANIVSVAAISRFSKEANFTKASASTPGSLVDSKIRSQVILLSRSQPEGRQMLAQPMLLPGCWELLGPV
jgi:hypothetical protein